MARLFSALSCCQHDNSETTALSFMKFCTNFILTVSRNLLNIRFIDQRSRSREFVCFFVFVILFSRTSWLGFTKCHLLDAWLYHCLRKWLQLLAGSTGTYSWGRLDDLVLVVTSCCFRHCVSHFYWDLLQGRFNLICFEVWLSVINFYSRCLLSMAKKTEKNTHFIQQLLG